MGVLFTALFAKIVAVVQWFSDLFVKIFQAIWDLLTDAVCWVFDGLLSVASSAINALDLSGLTPYADSMWSGVSGDVLNVLGLIGLGQALGIVAAAIVIRLTLQTIPFVRWGS